MNERTAEEAAVRLLHTHSLQSGTTWCRGCGSGWPCEAVQVSNAYADLAAENRALRAALERLVTVHDTAIQVEDNAKISVWGRIGREMDAAVEQGRAALAGAQLAAEGEG